MSKSFLLLLPLIHGCAALQAGTLAKDVAKEAEIVGDAVIRAVVVEEIRSHMWYVFLYFSLVLIFLVTVSVWVLKDHLCIKKNPIKEVTNDIPISVSNVSDGVQ